MGTNKITTGLGDLDKLLEGGLKLGELSIIMAPRFESKTNLIRDYQQRLIEQAKKQGYVIISHEMPPMAKTTYEKIGDTIFPVTEFPNGMVIVDYPDRLFCQQIKNKNYDNSTGSTNK
jgi:hypothetical protein